MTGDLRTQGNSCSGDAVASRMDFMRFSTDDWPESQRRSAAVDFYGSLFKQDIAPLPGQSFLMRGTVRQLPGLRFISVTTLGLNSRRRAEHISSDDVLVNINLEGTRILTNRGREFTVRGGEGLVGNEAETWGVAMPGLSRYISLRIPAHTLPRAAKVRSHLCQAVPSSNDVLRLLRSYVPVLADGETLTSPTAQALAIDHIRDLVATILSPRDCADVSGRHGVRAARLRAIKEDVARNLEHGDVSLAAIVARHRVSQRYVQKLFDSEGTTFSEHVLIQRLAHAHRALSDPLRAGEKIATIAFAAGFGDVSYFYRAFRRRYDVLPSDLRAAASRNYERVQ